MVNCWKFYNGISSVKMVLISCITTVYGWICFKIFFMIYTVFLFIMTLRSGVSFYTECCNEAQRSHNCHSVQNPYQAHSQNCETWLLALPCLSRFSISLKFFCNSADGSDSLWQLFLYIKSATFMSSAAQLVQHTSPWNSHDHRLMKLCNWVL